MLNYYHLQNKLVIIMFEQLKQVVVYLNTYTVSILIWIPEKENPSFIFYFCCCSSLVEIVILVNDSFAFTQFSVIFTI